jgi:S-DNA-T family DNA segregation ATPase FtsK/SpoIIIE
MANEKASTSKSACQGGSPKDSSSRRFVRYCLTLALLGAVALGWLSMVSFSPTDPPATSVYPPPSPVGNKVGLVGSHMAYALRYWVGAGSYAALVLMTLGAAVGLRGGRIRELPWRLTGLVLLVGATSAAAYVRDPAYAGEIAEGSAGVLGAAAGGFLLRNFGLSGGWIVLVLVFCTGVGLSADTLLKALARRVWRRRDRMGEVFAALRRRRQANAVNAPAMAVRQRPQAPGLDSRHAPFVQPDENPTTSEKERTPMFFRPDRPPAKASPPPESREPRRPVKADRTPRESSNKKLTVILPSVELLAEPESGYEQIAEIQAVQRKLVLQQTFDDFNIDAQVVGYMTGPVITLFEVSLQPGVKVAAIGSLATDIARALAVPAVRVVPPRFGKDTVGIEVPNLNKEVVRIKELMALAPDAGDRLSLPLYLGKDAGGKPIVVDLARMPHMLIAGTTGSGKSVCLNTIILSLLMHRKPDDLRFILIDPKMVELAAFDKIPHLLCPPVNDMRKAEDILEWAVTKMDERYALLHEAGVKNLDGYNRLSDEERRERFAAESEEEQARIPKKIPAWVIIVDELADLMMTSSKEVETYIIRIAQKARAVGIHLVLATQRPSANVVTGLIKSNMPCRVSFKVASGQESRIVLDQKGAEVLLGQGDMLVLQPGTSNLDRAQGAYVEEAEIRAVVKELVRTGEQHFDAELIRLQSKPNGEYDGQKDDLFDEAVEIILSTGRGSVSLLQRRMQIGYGRASRLIDQMAEAGLLGSHKGSQARECLLTLEDWEEMKAGIAADQSGASSLNGEPTSV